MLGHPSAENDIRARAAVLAEAMLSTNPSSDAYLQMRDEFREQLADIDLPGDEMTWFAMERVAERARVQAVRMDRPDMYLPAGALVMIDPKLPAPGQDSGTIKMLARAGFVIAPATWKDALTGVKLAGLAISGDKAEAATPRRPRGP